MEGLARALVAALAVVAALGATLPARAAGESGCANRVLGDWLDNGRLDRLYGLPCYEAALDDLPPDLRDYTDAADVIRRGLAAAVRAQGASGGEEPVAARRAVPDVEGEARRGPAVLLAAGGALLLALAGTLVLVRRARRGR
ncbi:MAG TPA: hypothetical protein VNJ53_07615 [Gaiellaceae bacterium]|nr:hypothetical protein [Gaiellaceae bacterium]